MDRNSFAEVQTPQCFDAAKLMAAYEQTDITDLSDDATVFEMAGHQVHLVDGEDQNLKITTPADLKLAEALLAVE